VVARLVPGKARKLVAVLVAGCALVCAASVPLAQAADDLKDKKHKVEKELEGAHDDLDHSSKELQEATAALQQSQRDLEAAQAYLAQTRGELAAAQALDLQMQAKLDAAEARLATARSDLAEGRRNVEEQTVELRRIVVANYQHGDPDLMGLTTVLTTQDPSQITGQLSSMQTVMDKEEVVLDRLEATEVLLTVKQREVNLAKIEVAERREAAAENLRRKESLEQQAEEAEAQVSEMVSLRAQARDTAVKAKNADLRELARLQAERERIERLILEQASKGAGYVGPSTGNGFLEYPVPGRVTSPYGWRTHPIWGYRALHDGVDFGVGCGTAIRAAAAGTVLSRYYQSAWGNRLIIDHGVKYGVGVASIYNHATGYVVSPGQHVKRDQVIGFVGSTGWSTGCHLHFTVLQNGQTTDPMRWL
jgi:murein DD-endopeptidase MepM/ murein hydrolase activator NlpD